MEATTLPVFSAVEKAGCELFQWWVHCITRLFITHITPNKLGLLHGSYEFSTLILRMEMEWNEGPFHGNSVLT